MHSDFKFHLYIAIQPDNDVKFYQVSSTIPSSILLGYVGNLYFSLSQAGKR